VIVLLLDVLADDQRVEPNSTYSFNARDDQNNGKKSNQNVIGASLSTHTSPFCICADRCGVCWRLVFSNSCFFCKAMPWAQFVHQSFCWYECHICVGVLLLMYQQCRMRFFATILIFVRQHLCKINLCGKLHRDLHGVAGLRSCVRGLDVCCSDRCATYNTA